MSTVLHRVEVAGRSTTVRLAGGRVAAVGDGVVPRPGDELVDGRGGSLLPGLHDHHQHVLAAAAVAGSLDVGTPAGMGRLAELGRVPGPWLRAVGHHEAVGGRLDRAALDRLAPHRPVRVQHRSGALWVLNSAALDLVAHVLDDSADVDRDRSGRPTGRLWRYDARLRQALPEELPDLAGWGSALAAVGVTGLTDATPDLEPSGVALLARAHASGELPQQLLLLGAASGPLPDGLTHGPRKLLLHDHDLPTFDELADRVRAARAEGRAVAVHCVTRESLLLTLAVLDEVGRVPGDRVEHASVVPEPSLLRGLAVVTQPGFLTARGDDYLREVDPDDVPHLYRVASLLAAGVPTAVSSDAPFGPWDPWQVLRAARDRRTATGTVVGARERVPATTALAGWLSPPGAPGGAPRRVAVGAPADLVLLHTGLTEAMDVLDPSVVRHTWIAGRRVGQPSRSALT